MESLVELKTVDGELMAINPRGVTALISHGDVTEVYLYGASQCFSVEGSYWKILDKLNGKE